MRITKAKLHEIGLLLVFKALLEVVYVLFVNPVYEYSGFVLDVTGIKMLESYIFVVFLYFFLPPGEQRISAIGTKLLFVVMVVPTLSLYALKDESRCFLYLFVAGFWVTLLTIQILPRIRVRKIRNMTLVLFLGLGAVSAAVYGILIKLNGMPTLRALNLSSVYEIRSVVSWGPPIMGYLTFWQGKVINSFLIGLAWYKRRYFALLLVLGLQLLLFLVTGHKDFLFTPLLVLFLVYAIEKRNMLRRSLWGLITVILVSYAIYAAGLSSMPGSLFIRRVLFVPAQINFRYHDFFSENEFTYLSQSHLGILLPTKNPYKSYGNIAKMMGGIYTGNPECNMNTGYMGDAYMNFGPLGVFIFSLILGVIFLIMDSIASRTDPIVAVAAMGRPTLTLIGGALFTTLGTHGLLLSMLIVCLYSRRTERNARRVRL